MVAMDDGRALGSAQQRRNILAALADDFLRVATVILGKPARNDRAVGPRYVDDVSPRIGAAGRCNAGWKEAPALAAAPSQD